MDEDEGQQPDEHTLGLQHAGDREAHIVGEQMTSGYGLSLCGKGLTIWPLVEGARVRLCKTCKSYATASRMAASSSYA